MSATPSSGIRHGEVPSVDLNPKHERLAELERRSLLAEQARQQAHSLRSPLSVIELVSETLQLELGEDRNRVERIDRVLDAVSTLSTKLTQSVRSNRFADGPKRPLDAARIAAEVVLAFGGSLDEDGASASATAGHSAEDGAAVLVDEQGFQAALVHLLRLIGVGYRCNGACKHKPLLKVEQDDAVLRLHLRLSEKGEGAAPVPTERADYRLMRKAAERVVRDCDGTLVLDDDHATLELPLAPTADA
jgi:hypothetical protein